MDTDEEQTLAKSVLSNKRRIESLRNQHVAYKQRQDAVKNALRAGDSNLSLNKKIVFDEGDKKCISSHKINSHRSGTETSALLFDSSSEEETDSFNNNEDDSFKIRPQFQGKAGERLLRLQSRFGSDNRFKMDERFLDADNQTEFDGDRDGLPSSAAKEKEKNIDIIESVLGKNIRFENSSPHYSRKQLMIRFDPSREDHLQFEVHEEHNGAVKQKSESKSLKNKVVIKEDTTPKVQPLPKVSNERYFEVDPSIRVFKNKDNSEKAAFSFCSLFDKVLTGNNGVPAKEHEGREYEVKRLKSHQIAVISNHLDSGENDVEDNVMMDSRAVTHSRESANPKEKTFFFFPGDSLLEESVRFFRCQGDFKTKDKQFRSDKLNLVKHYKQNKQRMLRKHGYRRQKIHIKGRTNFARKLKKKYRK